MYGLFFKIVSFKFKLTVLDSSNAKYLENCIAERDLVAFTCEEKDDMSILHRKLRVEQKLSVNILHSSAATEVAHKARQPISKLARYGFHSFLIDMVEAPVPILNALCRLNHIHQIPVGSDATYNTDDDNIPDYISTYFSSKYRKKKAETFIDFKNGYIFLSEPSFFCYTISIFR